MLNLKDLTTDSLLILRSMMEEVGVHIEDEMTERLYDQMFRQVKDEIDERKLSLNWDIYDDFKETNIEDMDLSGVHNNELILMEMTAAEIEDYSCLGRGVRKHVDMFWRVAEDEMKIRGIEKEFMCIGEVKL